MNKIKTLVLVVLAMSVTCFASAKGGSHGKKGGHKSHKGAAAAPAAVVCK